MRKLVGFEKLKGPARQSSWGGARILKCFRSGRAKFKRLGLFKKFRTAFPKVSPLGATNWEGLPMSGPKLRELLPGEGNDNPRATSGYEAAMPSPLETPALSVKEMPVLPALLITVNGVPD